MTEFQQSSITWVFFYKNFQLKSYIPTIGYSFIKIVSLFTWGNYDRRSKSVWKNPVKEKVQGIAA